MIPISPEDQSRLARNGMATILQPVWRALTGCVSARKPPQPKIPVVPSKISTPVWTIYPTPPPTKAAKSAKFTKWPRRTPAPAQAHTPDGPSSPRLQVLHNYELTEHILLQMDLEDLVRATAVCTRWHAITLTSKTLRTRLLDESIPMQMQQIQHHDFLRPETNGIYREYLRRPQILYNREGGDCWFFRIRPQSLHGDATKAAVVIYRTPLLHIELLVHKDKPQVITLDPKRTRLFGVFADCIWRVDGYDTDGNVAWKDLCGVYTNPWAPFCAYLWQYLVADEDRAQVRGAYPGMKTYLTGGMVGKLCANEESLYGWMEPSSGGTVVARRR